MPGGFINCELPLVSIGLPVYNAAASLPRALDALLAQDYPHWELIISDNASSDATPEVCQSYAARDARIQFHRSPSNLGSSQNFRNVFELSRGEYFMWAASDDGWDPGFVSRCVEPLQDNPAVVLSFPLAREMDASGALGRTMPALLDTRGLPTPWRFNSLMWGYQNGNSVYGMFRSSAARRTGLLLPVLYADIIFLAELSLLGSFALIPEPLFHRYVRPEEDNETMLRRWATDVLGPASSGATPQLGFWKFYRRLLRSIVFSPISVGARLMVCWSTLLLLPGRYRYEMVREVRSRFKRR